jgi:hypothetical protein
MGDALELIRWVAAWPLGAIGMAKTTMGELPRVRGLGDIAIARVRRPDTAPLIPSTAVKLEDETATMEFASTPYFLLLYSK